MHLLLPQWQGAVPAPAMLDSSMIVAIEAVSETLASLAKRSILAVLVQAMAG